MRLRDCKVGTKVKVVKDTQETDLIGKVGIVKEIDGLVDLPILVMIDKCSYGFAPIELEKVRNEEKVSSKKSSSLIKDFSYDSFSQVLSVEFMKSPDKIYKYHGVGYTLSKEMEKAASLGSFFNKRIKGKFDCVVEHKEENKNNKPIETDPSSTTYNYRDGERVYYCINGVMEGYGLVVGCAFNAMPVRGATYIVKDLSCNRIPRKDYPFSVFLVAECEMRKCDV